MAGREEMVKTFSEMLINEAEDIVKKLKMMQEAEENIQEVRAYTQAEEVGTQLINMVLNAKDIVDKLKKAKVTEVKKAEKLVELLFEMFYEAEESVRNLKMKTVAEENVDMLKEMFIWGTKIVYLLKKKEVEENIRKVNDYIEAENMKTVL